MLTVLGSLVGLIIIFVGLPWLLLLVDRLGDEWMELGPVGMYFKYTDWVMNRNEERKEWSQ